MPVIYHIAKRSDWEIARMQGFYEHPSLKSEGFIHCSQDHQVAGVLKRYFEGEKDLVKLVIDTDKLKTRFVFDWSPTTADTFPHVYGTINLDAVIETVPL
jgi:uncharacterized protein (DUF952 family)